MKRFSAFNNEPPVHKIRIAVLGNSLVGKSSLTYRFLNNKFLSQHEATIEECFAVTLNIEGLNVKLEIIDTAGQDDFATCLDTWISNADAFLLVAAINDLPSLNALAKKHNKIVAIKQEEAIALFVGNKSDLENERKVPFEYAQDFAHKRNSRYIETSAMVLS